MAAFVIFTHPITILVTGFTNPDNVTNDLLILNYLLVNFNTEDYGTFKEVNWRINKLLLPYNLLFWRQTYSFVFKRPFHFFLIEATFHSNQTNTIIKQIRQEISHAL